MKFSFRMSTDDSPTVDPRERMERVLERARAAREAGFDGLNANHRYSIGPSSGQRALPTSRFQPLLLLSRLAAEASGMDLITSIFLYTLYHPVELAEEIATLDAICGGRFHFGIGLGWLPSEFEAFGIAPGDKVSRFEESLEVMKRLWTEDDVTFHGKHFSYDHVRMVARPVQKPHPPIWIGASNDAAVRRAARMGDAWIISGHLPLERLEGQVIVYRRLLEEYGKPFPNEFPIVRHVQLERDGDAARKEALPRMEAWYRARGQWGWFLMEGKDKPEFSHSIIGSPEECIEHLELLQERLGVNYVVAGPAGVGVDERRILQTIELMGERVIPHFRKKAG